VGSNGARTAVLIFLLAGLGGTPCSHAQSTWEALQVSGPVPTDFYVDPLLEVQELLAAWEAEHVALPRKAEKQVIEHAYLIQRFLQSGEVLYGDSVSRYLQAICERLLANDSETLSHLRVYAVRATSPNAFVSSQGMVLVHLGLLAQLENEAQLAFVLSHEISHFQEKHLFQLLSQETESRFTLLRSQAPASASFPFEVEWEADSLGFGLYARAGYPASEAVRAIQLIQQQEFFPAARPFEERFLSLGQVVLPDSLRLEDSVAFAIPALLSSTHPSTASRLLRLQQQLQGQAPDPNPERRSSGRFRSLQKKCQQEMIPLYLAERAYETALYQIFLLKETGLAKKGQAFLQRWTALALYGLALHDQAAMFWDVHPAYEGVPMPRQAVSFLMEQLQSEDRTALALLHVGNWVQQHPDDREMGLRLDQLLTATIRLFLAEGDSAEGLQASISESPPSLLREVLQSLSQESDFVERFTEQRNLLQNPVALPSDTLVGQGAYLSLYGFGLGLEKVVLVDPAYEKVDGRKGGMVDARASAAAKVRFQSYVQTAAKQNGLTYTLLTSLQLDTISPQLFQELSLLKRWVEEKEGYGKLPIIPVEQAAVRVLSQKYGTPYFIWTKVQAFTEPRKGKVFILVAGGLFPPILPYSIYYALTPKFTTLMQTRVYNLETGKFVLIYPRRVQLRDRPDVLHALLHDLFLQVHQQR
jgi:Zn-dependent protease with chaperone function